MGKINGGNRLQTLFPDKVELEGTIRCLYDGGNEGVEQPEQDLKELLRESVKHPVSNLICSLYLVIILSITILNFPEFVIKEIEKNMGKEIQVIPYV